MSHEGSTMADYVMNSMCNGCKPKQLRGRRHYPRSGLLSRMMQGREVVRFLIAPPGFGKTMLALEYAETIFSFQNVFWLNAQSPCFLRDIDRDTLASSLLARGRAASLAVIEDLPNLTASRADAVSACIDKLLGEGWEVVVSMDPSCRSFTERQPDSVRISSADFMVSEGEIDALMSEYSLSYPEYPASGAGGWVPGFLWGGPDGSLEMLRELVSVSPPTDMLLALFTLVSLGEGRIEDIEAFTGPLKSDTRGMLEADYLFAGIDDRRDWFESYPFPIEDIARAFSSCLGRIAAASEFPDANTFIIRLADALHARGESERACLFVDRLCNARHRMAWLSSRSSELTDAGCLLVPHRMFERKALRLNPQPASSFMQEAWRLVALDDADSALVIARKVFVCAGASEAERGRAGLLVAYYGDADERSRAVAALRGLAPSGAEPKARLDAVVRRLRDSAGRWTALAMAGVWLSEDAQAPLHLSEACARHGRTGSTETGILLWSVTTLLGNQKSAREPLADQAAARVLSLVGTYLYRCESERSFGLWEAFLLDAWDEAKLLGRHDAPYPELPRARAAAQTLQVDLFSQRSSYEREKRTFDTSAALSLRGRSALSAPASRASGISARVSASTRERVPELYIRLFGGLEASIGGIEVDPKLFRRQKVKTLLALLTLDQGKDLVRERLSAILWPMSTPATAQRNFYSTWSLLRKALSLPGGDCPYLIRLQYGCKLDTRSVSSDIAEFEALCNRLLFDPPDVDAWSAIYTRLDELYRGDLLPSEGRNEIIMHQRDEYRSRLIDALVAASLRLFEQGGFQAALWFAHAAVRKDATREDAYIALMQAQIASMQRTAALDTYFKYKRYLADELGIDPSPRALILYQSIIEEEPGLESFNPKT